MRRFILLAAFVLLAGCQGGGSGAGSSRILTITLTPSAREGDSGTFLPDGQFFVLFRDEPRGSTGCAPGTNSGSLPSFPFSVPKPPAGSYPLTLTESSCPGAPGGTRSVTISVSEGATVTPGSVSFLPGQSRTVTVAVP